MQSLLDPLFTDEFYLAGQVVPSGRYRDADTGREVNLAQPDYLPASLDGRVAQYIRVDHFGKRHHAPVMAGHPKQERQQ